MNIVLFGDSLLARLNKSLITQLEQLIPNSVVHNCAAGGFTSIDGTYRSEYIARLSPDVAIFSFGANDVAPWKPITSGDLFLDNMEQIFESFSESRKILLICPDVLLSDQGQTHQFNQGLREYYNNLLPLCEKYTVELIDANEVLAHYDSDYHVEDGLHINDDAYRLILQAFAAQIKSTPNKE